MSDLSDNPHGEVEAAETLQTFDDLLLQALKKLADPAWLGENSPLAGSFFLGSFLHAAASAADAVGRGQTLQAAIRQAAAGLWGAALPADLQQLKEMVEAERKLRGNEGPRYLYYVLELAYGRQYFPAPDPNESPAAFRKRFPGRKNYLLHPDEIATFLRVGRSRYYAHLATARQRLAENLLRLLHPTFRLEQPILQTLVLGREALLAAGLEHLRAGQNLALSGAGGVGKTTLGLALGDLWQGPRFWYTFRSSLPGQLESLLFSLAYFCHQHGQSSLWSHLLANPAALRKPQLAVGFLRHDLEELRSQVRPLLCFDEVEMLRPANIEQIGEAQQQVVDVLEALRGLAPLLLIGQRIAIDTDAHFDLPGLDATQTAALLQPAPLSDSSDLSAEEIEHLWRYTGGNPRLIELCRALLADAGSPLEALENLPRSAAIQPLFDRLWRRLSPAERSLMQYLAVFRQAAPPLESEPLEVVAGLQRRHLLHTDQSGAWLLEPLFAALVYSAMTSEKKEAGHRRAARQHQILGEYTEAAYHHVQAGDGLAAIEVWEPRQDLEIQRGQAAAARSIFRNLSLDRLAEADQRRLKLLRSRLDLLAGDPASVLVDFDQVAWLPDQELSADAQWAAGSAAAELGDQHLALDYYATGLETLARVARKQMEGYRKRAFAQRSLGDLPQVQREMQLAGYEFARIQGVLAEYFENYEQAHEYFLQALALARPLADDQRTADTLRWLMICMGRLLRPDEMQTYAEEGIRLYEKIGDQLGKIKIQGNLGILWIDMEAYPKAIATLEPVLAFYERLPQAGSIAPVLASLAIAYVQTGQVALARAAAVRAYQMEDPGSYLSTVYALGLVQQKSGEFSQALGSWCAGLERAQHLQQSLFAAYFQLEIGRLYLRQGEFAAAEVELRLALDTFSRRRAGKADEVRRLLETLPG